jgi:hypothetical protein
MYGAPRLQRRKRGNIEEERGFEKQIEEALRMKPPAEDACNK